MGYEGQPKSVEYPLPYGDRFFYDGPIEHSLGAVTLHKKNGDVYARVGVFANPWGTECIIGSNNILTEWNVDSGIMQRMSIRPVVQASFPYDLYMSFKFKTTEPEALLVQFVREANEAVLVEDGLVYEGEPQSKIMMYYGKKVSIAERLVQTPLAVWLDWFNRRENRMVIDSGNGRIEWVRYTQTVQLEHMTELLRHANPNDRHWRDVMVDDVFKFRYQIIES